MLVGLSFLELDSNEKRLPIYCNRSGTCPDWLCVEEQRIQKTAGY
jgi:hypothetical protein